MIYKLYSCTFIQSLKFIGKKNGLCNEVTKPVSSKKSSFPIEKLEWKEFIFLSWQVYKKRLTKQHLSEVFTLRLLLAII